VPWRTCGHRSHRHSESCVPILVRLAISRDFGVSRFDNSCYLIADFIKRDPTKPAVPWRGHRSHRHSESCVPILVRFFYEWYSISRDFGASRFDNSCYLTADFIKRDPTEPAVPWRTCGHRSHRHNAPCVYKKGAQGSQNTSSTTKLVGTTSLPPPQNLFEQHPSP